MQDSYVFISIWIEGTEEGNGFSVIRCYGGRPQHRIATIPKYSPGSPKHQRTLIAAQFASLSNPFSPNTRISCTYCDITEMMMRLSCSSPFCCSKPDNSASNCVKELSEILPKYTDLLMRPKPNSSILRPILLCRPLPVALRKLRGAFGMLASVDSTGPAPGLPAGRKTGTDRNNRQ